MELQDLLNEIGTYLDANPGRQEEIEEFVSCYFLAPPVPFPEGTEHMDDAREWYERICELGIGSQVTSYDHAETRSMGFTIVDKETCTTLMIPLRYIKEEPEIRKLFQTPIARRGFAKLLEQGTAPKLPAP